MHRPCGIYISADQHVYVGELGWGMGVQRNVPNIGPRVSVLDRRGNTLARLGNGYGTEVGQFISPHGICIDSGREYLRGRGVAHEHQQLRRDASGRSEDIAEADEGMITMPFVVSTSASPAQALSNHANSVRFDRLRIGLRTHPSTGSGRTVFWDSIYLDENSHDNNTHRHYDDRLGVC